MHLTWINDVSLRTIWLGQRIQFGCCEVKSEQIFFRFFFSLKSWSRQMSTFRRGENIPFVVTLKFCPVERAFPWQVVPSWFTAIEYYGWSHKRETDNSRWLLSGWGARQFTTSHVRGTLDCAMNLHRWLNPIFSQEIKILQIHDEQGNQLMISDYMKDIINHQNFPKWIQYQLHPLMVTYYFWFCYDPTNSVNLVKNRIGVLESRVDVPLVSVQVYLMM